jgi:tetratricopeptide (TPR) repeat protein
MKKITLILLLFTNILLVQAQNTSVSKIISGAVYHDNMPLPSVNIYIEKDNKNGTTTDDKGFFTIKVNVDEILVFEYLGLKKIKIYIEDVTSILNVNMKADYNMLDEVSIKAKKKKESRESNLNDVIKLGRNNISVRKSGFGIKYISGKDLNPGALNIIRAVQGKAAGLNIKRGQFGEEKLFLRTIGNSSKAVLWDVDGVVSPNPPLIEISQVEHIAILSSLGATNSYGSDGAGGVVIISTKADARRRDKKNPTANKYTNKEIYNNDATPYGEIYASKPYYLKLYDNALNSQEAYNIYRENYELNANKDHFHYSTISFFQEKYQDREIILKILDDYRIFAKSNTEDLKAVAYKYQELNEGVKALDIYKKIALLRPKYAQSYRDLANAYLEIKQYKNAWKMHKYYFIKGLKIEDNDIGEILNSEMISTYLERKKDTTFKELLTTMC